MTGSTWAGLCGAALFASLICGSAASAQDRKAEARAFLQKELPGSLVALGYDAADLMIQAVTFTDQCTFSLRVSADDGSITSVAFGFGNVLKFGSTNTTLFFTLTDGRAEILPSTLKAAEPWEFEETMRTLYEDDCMPKG